MRNSTNGRTAAVVIGGSMAGVLAARVLSEHFDHVTIVERDALPSVPQNRRGVPQGKHLHALLAMGAEILEELFPGFGDDLQAFGGLVGDPGRHVRIHSQGGYRVTFDYGQRGYSSRPCRAPCRRGLRTGHRR
jgi:2-polyprenyl-6-methoxyphenol hydroxylase-like FAD-dependent oxidoreductase